MSSFPVDDEGLSHFTIDEVMHDFRDALVAIAPVLTRTGIDVGVDDDWDHIAEVLFDSIVLSPIRYSGYAPSVVFDKYEFVYDDYTTRPFFVVRDEQQSGKRFIFFGIAPNENRFDWVRAFSETTPKTEVSIPWSQALFSLRLPGRNDELKELTYC